MAEQQQQELEQQCDAEEVDNLNYKAPAQKTISEIQKLDSEDESLRKYKELLLGTGGVNPPRPNDPRNVIVEKLIFCSEGRPEIEMDLSGDVKEYAKKTFIVKEGSTYKLKICFFVQREIVSGLKYKNKTVRSGIQVEKSELMLGSYAPKAEAHQFETQSETLPHGLMARGTYVIKNIFCDDDKNKFKEWEFKIEIKKEWSD